MKEIQVGLLGLGTVGSGVVLYYGSSRTTHTPSRLSSEGNESISAKH